MAFGPGNHVFPGGAVEVADRGVPVEGSPPDEGARADETDFGASLQAVLVAAVREVLEEVGLLLARGYNETLRTVRGELLQRIRSSTAADEQVFGRALGRAGLSIAWDDFSILSRWITPEWFPRRFDTVFFLAKMSENQDVEFDDGEVESSVWLTGAEALYRWSAGRLPMMTATACVLGALHGPPFAQEHHLHGARPLDPVMFERQKIEGEASIVYESALGPLARETVLAEMRSLAAGLGET